MLPRTLKECRLECTARALIAVQRRLVLSIDKRRWKERAVLSKKCSVLARKLRTHSSDFPFGSFQFRCEGVTFRTKAELVHARVVATENYEKNVQDLKNSFLSGNGRLKKYGYPIFLSDLSSVN